MKLQEIQATLLDRKQALTQRLGALQTDLEKSHSADWSEQAQERENDEVLEELANQTSAELTRINQALERVEQGNYGICSRCAEPIAIERLKAIPETTTCIKCA